MDAALRAFALGDVERESVRVPTTSGAFERLPHAIYPALHETYLPALSEAFSRTAHEGPYGDAVDTGLTLLALYVTVYPPNYPQIGEPLAFVLSIAHSLCRRIRFRPRSTSVPTLTEERGRPALPTTKVKC